MSFSFAFDVDGEATAADVPADVPAAAPTAAPTRAYAPFREVPTDAIVHHLPERLSYSPMHIALDSGKSIALPRRDLFDVRFQLINDDDDGAGEAVANSESDLVPGVYEGGLKTWECAADLVAQLDRSEVPGTRAIEVGCGTAIPSVYLLQRLLRESSSGAIYLYDYNEEVLSLVVYPNLLLAWHFHSQELDAPGELDIDDELVSAFETDLARRGIALRFFAGGWDSYALDDKFDVVLSSETVYAEETLPSLVALLHRAAHPSSLCLVATKVMYFGVGGGLAAFEHAVRQSGGSVDTVRASTAGVARMVVRVTWP